MNCRSAARVYDPASLIPPLAHVMDAADILVRRGLLTEDNWPMSAPDKPTARGWSKSPCRWATAPKKRCSRRWAPEVGLEFVDLAETPVDLIAAEGFSPEVLHREALFPVRRENGTLVVATSDPFNLYPLDELECRRPGLTVVPVLASRGGNRQADQDAPGRGQRNDRRPDGASGRRRLELLREIETDGSELSEMAQEPSVVRLVNEILLEAIEIAGQRRAHRVAGSRACGSATASTACCTRSRCRRRSTASRRRSSAA